MGQVVMDITLGRFGRGRGKDGLPKLSSSVVELLVCTRLVLGADRCR